MPTDLTAPPGHRPRIVVLVSGEGTNLQAVVDGCHAERIPADVVGVLSDRAEAGGLQRARAAGIPAIAVTPEPGECRAAYDTRLVDEVQRQRPDVVVLAGWMRILSANFLDRFPDRVINLHPALPGELPGTHAIERAYDEFRAGSRKATGVMVHLVPDEGVDVGPVLGVVNVTIHDDDTLDTMAARVHAAEHYLLVRTLRQLCLPARRPKEVRV